MDSGQKLHLHQIPISINQSDFYLKTLIELNSVLENFVGESESAAFMNHVAQHLSDLFLNMYQTGTEKTQFTPHQLAEILVDLKRRIGGSFSIIGVTNKHIVLGNTMCPFGNAVLGRPSMCQMTATVFGKIVADSNGYAGIKIDKSIANGDGHCHVKILLEPDNNDTEVLREYFHDVQQ